LKGEKCLSNPHRKKKGKEIYSSAGRKGKVNPLSESKIQHLKRDPFLLEGGTPVAFKGEGPYLRRKKWGEYSYLPKKGKC